MSCFYWVRTRHPIEYKQLFIILYNISSPQSMKISKKALIFLQLCDNI